MRRCGSYWNGSQNIHCRSLVNIAVKAQLLVMRLRVHRGKKKKHFFWTSCISQTLNEQLCTWSLLLISINLKIKRRSPWNAENAHFEDITFYLRTLSSGALNWRSDTPSFVYSYNSKFYGFSNHLFKISSKRIACHGPLVILVLVGRCRRKPVFQ